MALNDLFLRSDADKGETSPDKDLRLRSDADKAGEAFERSVSDTVGETDTVAAILGKVTFLADSIGITDTLTNLRNLIKSLADSIGITDVLTKIGTFFRTKADSVGSADVLATARNLIKSLTDSIGITDAIATAKKVFVSVIESIGIADSLTTARDLIKAIADSIGITDVLTKIGTFFRTKADSVGATDVLTTIRNLIKSLADSIGITDAIAAKLLVKFVNLADNIGITDTVSKIASFTRTITNSTDVTDVLTNLRNLVKSLADSIGITDTLSKISTFIRTVTNPVSTIDAIARNISFARNIANNVGIADILSRKVAFFSKITDAIDITDTLNALRIKLAFIADSIGITDVIKRIGTFVRSITEKISIGSISSIIATLYGPRRIVTNPYEVADRDLLKAFHRASPDFDLMNSVSSELHKVAGADCRIYKLDIAQSARDSDDVYPELEYRAYLPPIRIKTYFVTPTWTEALSRLGINMPEEIVFSVNLQDLMSRIKEVKAVASKAKAGLNVEFNNSEPAIVYFYCDGEKIYSHLRMSDGRVIPDSGFELNILNQAGTIDLHHPAVNTVEKLTNFINSCTNYTASYSGNGGILSSEGVAFSGSAGNYDNWIDIKDNGFMLLFDRATGVYDNVGDVIESGDIIELFRRHEDTRNSIEDDIPIHDPVTLQSVRGKLYEVQYAMPTAETSTRHYVNYKIMANKVAMDVYDTLLDKLPADENFAVGSNRWYA